MTKARCWMCHGWQFVDKRVREGETAWNTATGGESGERFPIYELHPAFGTSEGELIPCPICY